MDAFTHSPSSSSSSSNICLSASQESTLRLLRPNTNRVRVDLVYPARTYTRLCLADRAQPMADPLTKSLNLTGKLFFSLAVPLSDEISHHVPRTAFVHMLCVWAASVIVQRATLRSRADPSGRLEAVGRPSAHMSPPGRSLSFWLPELLWSWEGHSSSV